MHLCVGEALVSLDSTINHRADLQQQGWYGMASSLWRPAWERIDSLYLVEAKLYSQSRSIPRHSHPGIRPASKVLETRRPARAEEAQVEEVELVRLS